MKKIVFAFLILFLSLTGCNHYELLSTGPTGTGEDVTVFEAAGNLDAEMQGAHKRIVRFKAGSELTESVQ